MDTPASIISLNFDPNGLKETQEGAKDLERIFGRVGGTFEKLAKTIAGLAGVGGVGKIVYDFMRIESAATRTALAVNNIQGQSGFINALTGAQAATGVDAVDLAGGIRASQLFAGGRFLRNTNNAGNYATYLGHMSQATGLDATTLGVLLGQGQAVEGKSFSQVGAQNLLSQAYTQSARAGQAGMSGEFLQALTGLVHSTGFFGRGSNTRSMGAFMGAAMAGDPAFANPENAASATGSVMNVIQGSLSNPRLMAALQMSGSNIHDILNGDPRSAMRLAKFARSQGKLPSELFFNSTFGQEGGRLMSDLADGRISPQKFQKEMKNADPQEAMKRLLERSSKQEDTALAELKKLEGSVVHDVAGPLKHIEQMIAGALGHKDAVSVALGIWGGIKLGKGINALRRTFGKGAAKGAEEAGSEVAAGAETAGKLGVLSKGLRLGSRVLGGPLLFGQEMLFPDKWLQNMTGGDLSADDWVTPNARAARNKLKGMTLPKAEKYLKGQIKSYSGRHDGDEQTFVMVQVLSQMLAELQKLNRNQPKGSGNQGAAFLPGNAQGGAASGNMLAAFIAGGSSASGFQVSATSLYPGGVGALGGGGSSGGGNPSAPSSDPLAPTKGGWQDCLLTVYIPSAGGINGRSGGGAWAGHPVYDSTWGCAAPSRFPFGTQIQFVYNGKTVIVPVVDRGGAITGDHFDLLPGPAKRIGLPGKANAKYKVVGSGGTTQKTTGSHSGSSGGSSGGSGDGSQRAGTVDAQGRHVPGKVRTPAHPQAGSAAYGGVMLGGGFPVDGTGGQTTINVNLDNRRIEQQRVRTRSM